MKTIKNTLRIALLLTILICAFSVCVSAESYGDLTYTVSSGKVTITDCAESVTSVTIPTEINGYPVTGIGSSAFYNCYRLTSITVPDSVTSIGRGAFKGCTGLVEITLPFVGTKRGSTDSCDSVFGYIFDYSSSSSTGTTSQSYNSSYSYYYYIPATLKKITITDETVIPYGAFYNCSNVTSITINDGITKINNYAFYNCTGITSFTIPDSVMSIGSYAFYNCTGITSIVIPDDVTSISSYLFNNCTNLVSITVPDGLTSIGGSAFYNCTKLEGIRIPTGVKSIGSSAFYNCSKFTSITIPDSVTSIGSSAFYNCYRLTSITVPDSVTSIGEGAFRGCTGLVEITLPFVGTKRGSTDSYDSVFGYIFDYSSSSSTGTTSQSYNSSYSYYYYIPATLKKITITDETVIPYGAFYNCSNVTSITINDGITKINDYAFYNCTGLKNIKIPDSVISINSTAFNGCSNLKDVYFEGSSSEWNSAYTGTGSFTVHSATKYVISYDANGGTGAPASQIITDDTSDFKISDKTPTREGFLFLGWSTNVNGSVEYRAGGTYADPSDLSLFAVWIETYDISYNANGGENAPSTQKKIKDVDLVLSEQVPTKFGYAFIGWAPIIICKDVIDISVTGKESSHNYANNENKTWVISHAGADSISLTFDSQTAFESSYDFLYILDGNGTQIGKYSGTELAGKTIVVNDDYITLRLTSDSSNVKWGFKVTKAVVSFSETIFDDVEYHPGDTYTVNAALSLYAAWNANDYSIEYNANGGAGAPESQTKIYDTDLTLSNIVPSREGYNFLGWSTSSTATLAGYAAGGTYTDVGEDDVTLYAVWQLKTYTVSYNANGGSSAPSSQTKKYFDNLVLTSSIPTRTGYTFKGWSTTSNGAVVYAAGSTYTTNQNLTLYAIWEINKYTISYNANGGTGAPSSQIKTYGTNLTLSSVVPIREGYNFLGWSTSSTATSASYSAGGSYSSNSNATLYAVWQLKTYTVSYNANGGSSAPSSQTKKYFDNLVLTSSIPTRTGYTFKGWSTTSNGAVVYAAGSTYTTNQNLTLYAVWEINKYTVSYNANGGAGAPASQTETYGTTIKLSDVLSPREGYDFLGWSTNTSGGAGAEKSLSVSGLESDHNYSNSMSKTWTISYSGAKSIKLTFDSRTQFESNYDYLYIYNASGTQVGKYSGTSLAGKTITVDGDKISLKLTSDGSQTYWGFKVTSATASFSAYEAGDSYTVNSDVTFYAVWQLKTYTVSYNANGGSSAPDSQTKNYFDNLVLTSSIPTRTGYTFKGWATTADGQVVYNPGDTYAQNEVLTLYAVWEIDKYTISYDANGGTGAPESQTKTYGTNLTLSSIVPEREGYNFLGWSTSSTATTASYSAGGSYSSNNGTTLYAVWKEKTYSVTYDGNGGSSTPGSQTKYYFTNLTLRTNIPTRTGYNFLGWSTTSDGEVEYNPGDTYTNNESVTLYAVWEVPVSGSCGENASWSISEDNVLTISGNGAMTNYSSSSDVPWYANRSNIAGVVIDEGITSIGAYALYYFNIDSIEIPDSVTSIGSYAFAYCSNLSSITIPDSVTSIGSSAFYNCSASRCFDGSNIQWSKVSNPSSYSVTCKFDGDYIALNGETDANAGDELSYDAHFSSSYKIDYLISTIKYPKTFAIKEITNKDFEDNTIDTEYSDDEYNYVTIISTYSFEGERTEQYKGYTPYEIVFDVSETCPLGTCTLEFVDETIALGDDDYELILDSIEVFVPDVLTIYGDSEISGETQYTVSGVNSVDVPVTWSVDDENVATISNHGVVTPITNGSVVITATYTENDAIFATKSIDIVGSNITDIEIMGADTVYDGEKYTATLYPENLKYKTITWSVDDESVATISSDGVLTAVGAGTVNVIATVNDATQFSKSITVTIPSVNAVVDNLYSDVGTWDKEFAPYEREYTITVQALVDSISFTGTYSSGSLKCDGLVLMNGRSKSISLVEDVTILTFERGDVSGKNDSEYVVTVIKRHSYGDWTVTIEPTCTEDGEKKIICTVCGDVKETEVIPELGHDHVYDSTVDSTCTEAGYELHICSRCDDEKQIEIPANGHEWSEWVETKAPTYVETGIETRTCDVCGETEDRDIDVILFIDVESVSLNKTSINLNVGDTVNLDVTIVPEDASDKTITWTSSNNSVATVDEDGVVKAIAKGSATITATSHNGISATCEINVGVVADNVEFASLKTTSLAVGKTLTLKATASRTDGIKPQSTAVTYEIIEGEDFATIDAKGKFTAKAVGEVVVRATAEFGTEEAYADVTINVCIPATKVTLNKTTASMIVDGTLNLTATMTPSDNTDTITWSVDNDDIATVDENGVVTAHKAGKVKITATTGSGKKATCTITVGAPADTVTFSSLKTTSLAVGKTLSLSAKASCEDGTKPVSTNVVYEIIEGEEYATIDAKGKLVGKDIGTVVVRARAEAGTEDAYADVIINVCNPATKVTLNMTKATMIVGGEDLSLEATMTPANNTDTLTWSVDKEDIASVEDGVVTARKPGKIKVTATSGSGKSASCTITIGAPADTVTFSSLKTTSLAVGKTLSLSAKASCEDGTKPVSTNVVYEIIEGDEYASIDSKGKLKGVATGEVVVRARAEAGTEDAYVDVIINVCNPATKVTLNMTKATMIVGGEDLSLEATMTPANNTDTLTWSVDKDEIATVDENGVVTAYRAGKVKVTAASGSGNKATCTITVGEPADTVEFTSLKTTSLAVGKTLTLKAKASCEDGTKPVSTNVVYEIIEGDEYASIDAKGKIKGIATGEVTVRARAEAGTEDAYADVIINVCIPATKVTLNMTKATLSVGDELQLEVTMAPDNNTDTITWSVDKGSIATVDEDGLVTAHSAGKVKVTATSGSGKKATCTITVTK